MCLVSSHSAPSLCEQGQFAGGSNLCQDMPREAWIVWVLLSGIFVYMLTLPLRKHEAKRQTSLPNLTALPRWLCVLLPVGCGFLRVAPSGCFPFFPRGCPQNLGGKFLTSPLTFQHHQERQFDYLHVFCKGIARKGSCGPVVVSSVVCIPCGEAADCDGLDLKLAPGFKSWLHDLTLWIPLCLLVLDHNWQ